MASEPITAEIVYKEDSSQAAVFFLDFPMMEKTLNDCKDQFKLKEEYSRLLIWPLLVLHAVLCLLPW